jgi:hypothetical protein
MHFDSFSFGSIQIDGTVYEHDVIIDRGEICKRKKKPSKKFQEQFGHTPLSIEEEIPWAARRRERRLRPTARDAGSRTRSRASQDQIARPAHQRSHRRAEAGTEKHQCNSSRDVLNVCKSREVHQLRCIDTAREPA